MPDGLQFDPLAAGAYAYRVTAVPTLRKGEWNTLLDVDGPGMITHLWFTFPGGDKMLGRRCLLRCFWDDEPEPSVVAPLADFFGVHFGFSGGEYRLNSRYLVVGPNQQRRGIHRLASARISRGELPRAASCREESYPREALKRGQ